MEKCYICGVELDGNNRAEEHIVLNAIGGVLKSKKLICKQCNSDWGNKADSQLVKQLNAVAVLMNVKRERGEAPPIKAIRTSNKEEILIYPGGKLGTINPNIHRVEENGQKKYHISARNKREVKKIYNQIKNKYPSAKIVDTGEVVENINEKVFIECDLNTEALESVCKTAIGYYLHTGGEQEHVQSLIDKLKEHNIKKYCNYCYDDNISINKNDVGIFHSIAMVGEPKQKLLYAYIEFFNYYHVVVLLNDQYSGKEFRNIYCYNLNRKCESKASFAATINRKMIFENLEKELIDCKRSLVRELNKTVRIIELRNAYIKVMNEIQSEYKEKHSNEISDNIFLKDFEEKLLKELQPYFRESSSISE